MTKWVYRVWTAIAIAGTHSTCEDISLEGLNPAQQLLLDVDTWMPRANIDLKLARCGGRCLPWPTIIETKRSMNDLLGEDPRTHGPPYKEEPHVTKMLEEGVPATIPSGVGTWARALEATWTHNGRLWWQHEPTRPDYTDHRVGDRFHISPNVDLTLNKITTQDSGMYTARFRLRTNGPVYIMETNLTVYHHPQPRILNQRMKQGARRLTLGTNDTSAQIRCDMTQSHPNVVLGWEKDSTPVPEAETKWERTPETTSLSLNVTRADNGSLLTCTTSNTLTSRRKTATISIKVHGHPEPAQQQGSERAEKERSGTNGEAQGREAHKFLDEFLKEFQPGEEDIQNNTRKPRKSPGTAELGLKQEGGILGTTTEKLTMYLMASVALTAATVGATLSVISKCNGRSQGARYLLTRTYTTQ